MDVKLGNSNLEMFPDGDVKWVLVFKGVCGCDKLGEISHYFEIVDYADLEAEKDKEDRDPY